jgi:ribosomal protein S18 acetylase RimI-like enzyme
VRPARAADAERISALITQLGFVAGPELVGANLATLTDRQLSPLVAEAEEVVGCISISVMHVLHRPLPVGRISMLVVAPGWRGKGVGRALVEQALEILRQAGCGLCEVTSNYDLLDAHAFYERLGFERTSVRLARGLQP